MKWEKQMDKCPEKSKNPNRYLSTKSVWKVLVHTTVAGLGTFVGGTFGLLLSFFWGNEMPKHLQGAMFCITAGIMTMVSFIELLPEAFLRNNNQHNKTIAFSLFLGMMLMQSTIILLHAVGAE